MEGIRLSLNIISDPTVRNSDDEIFEYISGNIDKILLLIDDIYDYEDKIDILQLSCDLHKNGALVGYIDVFTLHDENLVNSRSFICNELKVKKVKFIQPAMYGRKPQYILDEELFVELITNLKNYCYSKTQLFKYARK